MTVRRFPFPELAGHQQIASQQLADLSPIDAGRGLIVEAVDLEALVRDDPRFTAIAVRSELGLQVECHLGRPSVFLFSAPGGLSIARGPEVALAEHQGAIALDLGRLERPALLRGSNGRLVVLERLEAGLSVQAFAPDTTWRPAPRIESPVETWAAGDPWLAQAIAPRVSSSDPFDQVVAVGLAWRLVRREPAAQRSRAMRLLAGQPATEDLRERDWVRSVPPETWGWVERRALQGVAALRVSLDRLVEAGAPTAEAVVGACRERDLLEGVALALQTASSGAELEPALEDVDVLGSATLGAIPPASADDEQLRRAAVLQPDVWWVQPARPTDRGR
jgi:hypothetical protein